MRRVQDHMKSDERILGDGDFALSVLDEAKERLEARYRLQAQGYDLEKVTIRVSSELGIGPEQVWRAGKTPNTVKARSLLCYWASYSQELCMEKLGGDPFFFCSIHKLYSFYYLRQSLRMV